MIDRIKSAGSKSSQALKNAPLTAIAAAGAVAVIVVGAFAAGILVGDSGDVRSAASRDGQNAQNDGDGDRRGGPGAPFDGGDGPRSERHAERKAEMAESLASKLDGVSAGQVTEAHEAARDRLREELSNDDERPERGEARDRFNELFADELGVSAEELDTARREAELERLDQAVEDGEVSEERADEIRKCINDEDCGPEKGGPFGGPGHHGPPGPGGPPFGGPRDGDQGGDSQDSAAPAPNPGFRPA